MDYCNKCGGTGVSVNGKFCTCETGRFKKSEHEEKLQIELYRAEKLREKHYNPHPDKKETLKLSYFDVNDWVEVRRGYHGTGSIGFVTEVDADDKTANVVFVTYGKSRRPCYKKGWIDEAAIMHYNPPAENEDIKVMIDFALQTQDKKWFDQLTKKGAKNEL